MADLWTDFENFVTYTVPKMTIPKLRQFADRISVHAHINLQLKSQERKSDLLEKIRGALKALHRANRTAEYVAIRREAEQLLSARPTQMIPAPTFGGVPAPSSSNFAQSSRQPTMGSFAAAGAGSWNRGYTAPGHYVAAKASSSVTLMDWKASPLWKPLRALTGMEMLPDISSSESSHVRRERRATFNLPTDVIEMLNKTKNDPRARPIYSVRLFCASSEYYRPPGMAVPPGQAPINNSQIPIEYPINPDVVVDDHSVPFKERGLRGKAGSAPPLDLDKSHRGLVRIAGRMGSVTMGHTGPTVSKKKEIAKRFWFQVVFCEMTTTEDLLAKLEALVPTDAEAERAKMSQEDDDDIQIGPSHLSLKDPLSGMRITKPVRSSKCSHLQCFDARWWLEANRSHPQWLCPHCSKEVVFSEIVCDGYFLSILNAVPDDYDDVVLESNGDWHTTDNRFGTPEWLKDHPPIAPEPEKATSPLITVKRSRSESVEGDPAPKRQAIEILSDSDDDEPLANSRPAPAPAPRRAPAVIDLTLSDSEDEQVSDDDDEVPLANFTKPGVASTVRDVAASPPRPAENQNPPRWLSPPAEPNPNLTAFSDALRSILDSRPGTVRPGFPHGAPSLAPLVQHLQPLNTSPNGVPARLPSISSIPGVPNGARMPSGPIGNGLPNGAPNSPSRIPNGGLPNGARMAPLVAPPRGPNGAPALNGMPRLPSGGLMALGGHPPPPYPYNSQQ